MSGDAERYGPQLDDLLEEEERRALRAEGSKRKPPRPTGNLCAFCVPVFVPEPTGRVRLRHSVRCPDKPREPISAAEYAKGRTWPST